MKRAGRGFVYALEALRRKREWELETARMQLAEVNRLLKRAQDHLDALEIRFAAARHEWSRRASDGRAFELHWQRVATAYLAEITRQAVATREQIAILQREREQSMQRVGDAHLALEALEKHRAQAVDEHAREASRREYRVADEGWLQRIPDGDPA